MASFIQFARKSFLKTINSASKAAIKAILDFKDYLKKLTTQELFEKLISTFVISAEVSNIGIVITVISHWSAIFAAIAASGPIAGLTMITDPLIYFFRSLIRLTKLIGSNYYDLIFHESAFLNRKERLQQSIGDVASLILFILAISFFAGIVAAPIGITVAWSLGLLGLMFVGYTDHYLPQKGAARHVAWLKKYHPNSEALEKAETYHKGLRNSTYLYYALIAGLSLLLICGSAAAFAPPAVVPFLMIITKIASIYLGMIAIGRFSTWIYNRQIRDKHKQEALAKTLPHQPHFHQHHNSEVQAKMSMEAKNTHWDTNFFPKPKSAPKPPTTPKPEEADIEVHSNFSLN